MAPALALLRDVDFASSSSGDLHAEDLFRLAEILDFIPVTSR